jgi:putative ABC transport system permease protein
VIVGVAPEALDIEGQTDRRIDVWQPLLWHNGEGSIGSTIVARLPDGVDLATAAREVDEQLRQAPVEHPDQRPDTLGIALMPLEERGRMYARPGLLLLQGAAGLFLLLACVNLANLLLVQSGSRRREMGIRAAAGAERARVLRQVLTEAGVVAIAGGALGVLAAYVTVPVLVDTASWALPRADGIAVRWPELAAGLALAAITTLAAATIPAWLGTRSDVVTSLRTSAQMTTQRGTRLLRASLVGVEVALALTILTTAGLLIHSFARVISLPLGFDPHGVVIAEVPVSESASTPGARLEAVRRMQADLMDQLGGHPIAVANSMPYAGSSMGPATPLSPSGRYERFGTAVYRTVSPEYFDILRIPIVRGRNFTASDSPGAERVVIVNEAFVREYAPVDDIVGARIRLGPRDVRVVGVAGDTRNYDLTTPPQPVVHWPIEQRPVSQVTFAVRGAAVSAVSRAAEQALSRFGADLAPRRLDTLEARIGYSQAQRRFYFLVFALLAVLGTALAALGVYAVTAHVVGLRTRELAIRLALGSTHRQIEGLVVRQGFVPVAAGVVAGLAGAWWAGGWLSSHPTYAAQLYQVTSHDPATVAAAALTAVVLGGLACWLPARRTGRADPAAVLRVE